MKQAGFHEEFGREERVTAAPEKSLGIVFAFACLLIGGYRYWRGDAWALWLTAGFPVFLLLAFFWHLPLKPLNYLWFKLSVLLYTVVNPIVLGLLFYGTILPVGWLMRLTGKDPLRLKLDAQASSYWIARNPPGPAPESMKHLF